MMIGLEALLAILWSGVLVLCPRGVGSLRLLESLLGCLGRRLCGQEGGKGWPALSVTVELVAFLSSSRWPSEVHDLGCGGISHIELLFLYERWAGGRLVPEKYVPKFRRPGQSMSASAAPLDPGTDIWKLCQHLAGMMRAL